MPNWEGIEDSSAQAFRVWLTRKDETEQWTPLRKCDCHALNEATANGVIEDCQPVYIEGGRCSADTVAGIVFNNFFRAHQRQLCSAIWFLKQEKDKATILVPLTNKPDSEAIEDLYQSATRAASSLGKGVSSVLKEEIILHEDEANAKVKLIQTGNTIGMRRVPNGWFAGSQELQRGYGAYEVEGEEDEMILGPVKHLVFVIHGIGEAWFARDDVKITGLVEQMNRTRIDVQRRQVKQWKELCETAAKEGGTGPPPPSRIEFLPVEWFDHLHDSSSAMMKSLQATTLQSIPALRAIANDVVFDVLMYMTPAFCESVLNCVTQQVIDLQMAFLKIHPDFVKSGGKFSFIGHSLGSVIVWDLLSVLKDHKSSSGGSSQSEKGKTGYQAYAQDANADNASNGTWGPSLTKKLNAVIPFEPDTALMLGSPLGMFLTLRGAHAVFDELREKEMKASNGDNPELLSKTSPFSLPVKRFYNVYNPSDPVAYRIEPLLLSPDVAPENLPEPMYLTAPGSDVRLHIKARKITNSLKKNFLDSNKSSWNMLIDGAVTVLAPESDHSSREVEAVDGEVVTPAPLRFALGGKSHRVDFSFQPGVIESQYLSAVLAHSTMRYFGNEDLQDFLLTVMGGDGTPL